MHVLLKGARGVKQEKSPPGIAALFRVIKKGSVRALYKLIDAGADVNATEERGITPLFWAMGHGKEDMARALIGSGADLQMQGVAGYLHHFGPDVVASFAEIWPERAACAEAAGHTVQKFDLAWKKTPIVLPFIFNKKAAVDAYFSAAVAGRAEEVVRLIQKGVDPHVKNEAGEAILPQIYDRRTLFGILAAGYRPDDADALGALGGRNYTVLRVLLDNRFPLDLSKLARSSNYLTRKLLYDAGHRDQWSVNEEEHRLEVVNAFRLSLKP